MTPFVPEHLSGRDLPTAGWAGLAALAVAGLLLAWWYLRGLVRVRAHAQGRRRYRWRLAALVAGVATVLVVTLPPLGDTLDRRLSTHMAQHLALIIVAAPLIALAAPAPAVLAGMPRALRRRAVSAGRRSPTFGLLTPHVAWALHIGALWLWHLPAAYDAAVESETVHVAEHAAFLGTAVLFWWHLLTPGRRRLRGPAALFYVVAAVPPGAALGAVLTFPEHPLYPAQAALAAATGVDPMLDQRIGGLVMWIPLDFAYLALAVVLFARWMQRLDTAGGAEESAHQALPPDARPAVEAPR
jgi:cytochrome c oxidase assembly factor CtaG